MGVLTASMYADPQAVMFQTHVETILTDSGASDVCLAPSVKARYCISCLLHPQPHLSHTELSGSVNTKADRCGQRSDPNLRRSLVFLQSFGVCALR